MTISLLDHKGSVYKPISLIKEPILDTLEFMMGEESISVLSEVAYKKLSSLDWSNTNIFSTTMVRKFDSLLTELSIAFG